MHLPTNRNQADSRACLCDNAYPNLRGAMARFVRLLATPPLRVPSLHWRAFSSTETGGGEPWSRRSRRGPNRQYKPRPGDGSRHKREGSHDVPAVSETPKKELPEDCLLEGLRVVNVTKWNKLPKGQGIPLQHARAEFLKRSAKCPGPYTLVYKGPEELVPSPPPPRDTERLVEYLEKPQYVPQDESKFVKQIVDQAWAVVGQNARLLEHQKEEFMYELHKNVKKIESMPNEFDALFEIPAASLQATTQKRGKEARKKALPPKSKR